LSPPFAPIPRGRLRSAAWNLNIQANGIREAGKRSEIIRRSGEETNAIITKGYEQRSATNDRTFNSMSRGTRGVETYRNPSTGETIDLSN
jgi:hypothetical protein